MNQRVYGALTPLPFRHNSYFVGMLMGIAMGIYFDLSTL